MDKFKAEQKKVPHFIWHTRDLQARKHGSECDYDEVIKKYNNEVIGTKDILIDKNSFNEIIFDTNTHNDISSKKGITVAADSDHDKRKFTNKRYDDSTDKKGLE